MIRALSTAATGLEAQQANIERVSSDIANINTDAYKRSRGEFQDLMYETTKEPGAALGNATISPVGVQTGLGVKVGAAYKVHEQGPARMTYRDYDLMIEGPGFFPIQMPSGEIAYTRMGSFHPDAQGRLIGSTGGYMIPQITVPSNAVKVTIAPNGEVRAQTPDNGEVVLGQVQLIRFQNDAGLKAVGSSTYVPSPASGAPQQGIPGENGMGTLSQGALEGSNVNIANSMVEMIQTQRGYEMNARVISTADKMLETLVNIK